MNSIITGIASYLPPKILTNDDLSHMVDTNNEWIVSRTGIETRHIAENETTYDLAYKSALKSLKLSNLSPNDIDCIIVATTTPHNRCPSTACKVQSLIQAKNAFAFDIQAACSGFIYGLSIADSFIKTKKAQNILLIGAETMSTITDWTDRSTCVLFGDGAGSCIVSANQNQTGIISTKLYADGDKYDQIIVNKYISMNGQAVFKSAIKCMSSAMQAILEENNMTINDIDWIIPHQANARIITSLCELNNYPIEKTIISIQNQANTSSATIPLAMDFGIANNKIKSGDTLLLTSIGAGLTWGSAIIKL